MQKIKNQMGFSLIELMIVVAIIGILAAIAVPNFARFQAKSRQSEARADLASIYTAQKAFNSEWQTYFADLTETGYKVEGQFRYEHGFADAGTPVTPPNYIGPLGAGAAAVDFSTVALCGAAPAFANGCSVIRGPNAPNAPTTGVTAQDVFVAMASGDIDDDATLDEWTIDQDKQITSTNQDLD